MTKTAKTKPVAKAKPTPPTRMKGHWGIASGSRKEQIAKVLDSKGRAAAIDMGNALGLSKATVTSWIAFWGRTGLFTESKATTKSDRKQTAAKANHSGGEGIVRDANGNIEFNQELLAPEDRNAA